MDFSKLIPKFKNSIAFVVSYDPNGQLVGTGSGFLFLKKGVVVTCNHVVKDAAALMLKFPDAEEYISAKILVKDEEHDLALLRAESGDRNPLQISDEVVCEGTTVVFSGYPVGLMNLTTHQGIISGITQDVTGITTYLIDGTVNSGNSGCPLMDQGGKVMGVVNAKRRVQNDVLEKVEGMNFGALSLHGTDIVQIYRAIINNVQLGIGYAIPASYIPDHKEASKISRDIDKIDKSRKK